MKKFLAYLAAGSLFIGSCTENELSEGQNNIQSQDVSTRMCATDLKVPAPHNGSDKGRWPSACADGSTLR